MWDLYISYFQSECDGNLSINVCGLSLFVGILMVFSRYVQSVVVFDGLGILRKEVPSSCIPSVLLDHMEGLGSQGCQP